MNNTFSVDNITYQIDIDMEGSIIKKIMVENKYHKIAFDLYLDINVKKLREYTNILTPEYSRYYEERDAYVLGELSIKFHESQKDLHIMGDIVMDEDTNNEFMNFIIKLNIKHIYF